MVSIHGITRVMVTVSHKYRIKLVVGIVQGRIQEMTRGGAQTG